jgi:glutamyl-tRNA synthetase
MTQNISPVRTRMAPSPTGEMHVGSMSILLKNYASAKKHQGKFILRIEDTDQEREVPGAVERILSTIKAYGLDWDEGPDKDGPFGPYTQSDRLPIYQEKAQELVNSGHAYYCNCSRERLENLRDTQRAAHQPPKYDRHCLEVQDEVKAAMADGQPYVIRLKAPSHTQVSFDDLIRGKITMESDILDDQVLLKSDGFPTYHLAVVIDDHLMQITHILRGEEWISSTPKHILLYQAFGWPSPIYAHIPVFLNPDGKGKMSKRKGTVSAQSFLEAGFLPEALLNFFMILGWTPRDQREIITLDEYIQEFDPKDVSPNSVVFDVKKLEWLNGIYIRNLSVTTLISHLEPFFSPDFPKEKASTIIPLIQERLVRLSEITELTEFFYREIEAPAPQVLTKKSSPETVASQLQLTKETLEQLSSWKVDKIETAIRTLQEKHDWHKRQYFMMLRIATTGREATPPLFETLEAIGQKEIINRLMQALTKL